MGFVIGGILLFAIWFLIVKALLSKLFMRRFNGNTLAKEMNDKAVQTASKEKDSQKTEKSRFLVELPLESIREEREQIKEQKIKNKVYKELHRLADAEAKDRIKGKVSLALNQNREDAILKALRNLAKFKILGHNQEAANSKEKSKLTKSLKIEISSLRKILHDKTNTKYKVGVKLQEAAKKLKINEFSLTLPKDPVLSTGDEVRLNEYRINILIDNSKTSKFLYVAKVKSGIDEKRYTLIGVSDDDNIKGLFKGNDVVSLIEVHRCVKFNSNFALVLQYNMIKKYRPANYFVEKEFNEFERFDGYINIVPMAHTTQICKRIDIILDNYDEAYSIFKETFKSIKSTP